jgi:hypothetical protein
VVFVCCSRRALSHVGVGLMGWCQGIYTCVGICGRVMHRDLWSYLYSRKGGAIIIGNVYADALARKSITTYSDVAITPSKQPAQREIPSTASTGLLKNTKNIESYKITQTQPSHLC